jgi:hypothetical protein
MTAQVKHYEMRYEDKYIAKLREQGDECEEIVFFNGEQIHRVSFPSSNLGCASRGEYLRTMVASIAREHSRKA